jgi:HK97 family phage portal protein
LSFLTRLLRAPDPPHEPPETRDWSITDPGVFALFGGAPSLSGVTVSEHTALGLSAVWRCVSLISGSIASLPLRTIRTNADGTTQRAKSWLDNPAGPLDMTPHEFVETAVLHLCLHGNVFALKIFGGAGQLLGLQLVHPSAVGVELKDGRKRYRVALDNGQSLDLTDRELVHIPAQSTDGIKGLSPITVARNSLGTSIAGERAAARLFSSGALMSAIATVDEELSEEDAKILKEGLDRKVAGEANAGQIALINRKVNIHPWSVSPEDAEFLSSRAFQVDEVARWYGVPPHLLGQTEKQTSFGAGLTEQNRGLARYVLIHHTSRIEQRLSRLLPDGLDAEFDYSMLVKPSPEDEIALLVSQVESGILTRNEARRIRNLPPIEGGDVLVTTPAPRVTADV